MINAPIHQASRAPRRPRADGERTRGAILRAAASLATIEGLEGLSIGHLADATGMSKSVCRATIRTLALSWCFLCSSGCSAVLADQALDGVGALDAGGRIGRLAGLVQRRSLFPRLVRPMLVVVPRVLGQDPPEVSFAVDQQVVEALAP